MIATCWLVSKAKAVQYIHCQQISASKDRTKIRIIKKDREERVGKRVAFMPLVKAISDMFDKSKAKYSFMIII